MEFVLHISGGEITNKAKVRQAFTELATGKYLVTIKNIKKRSLQQNKYYWGCMIPLIKEGLRNVGYDEVKNDSDAHEVIKALFLKRKIKSTVNDDEIEISGSTAKLTTTQFGELIEEVIKWAVVYLSIEIPYPNEPVIMFCEHDPAAHATIVEGGNLVTNTK